ncbi:hypothetical protein [Roseibium sp.]|uniref:hypothetical protein n=1 Tax=Roseibium sp. TaxID=1936156 RepID=UPI003D0E279C
MANTKQAATSDEETSTPPEPARPKQPIRTPRYTRDQILARGLDPSVFGLKAD